MLTNNRIADLIRDDKPSEITEAIGEGAFYEMQTLSKALIDLVLRDQIDREVAANAAPTRHDFLIALDHAEKAAAAAAAAPSLKLAPDAGDNDFPGDTRPAQDRKSTRLNSSHRCIS